MTNECNQVPANGTFDCVNPWGNNCTSSDHFEFTSLWGFTYKILQSCPNDSRLFKIAGGLPTAQNASLTQAECEAIAGSAWNPYQGVDIWDRLTTWKFPLLQLVGLFPRPPLSLNAECFVITHFLGDPINTTWHLFDKLAQCQRRAEYWGEEYRTTFKTLLGEQPGREWKALALIEDAYDEWDEGGKARDRLWTFLNRFVASDQLEKDLLRHVIQQTAGALAADRATKFLPIMVAQAFFIGTVAIAFGRTVSAAVSSSSTSVFINVEAHSIAFSALYFWVIPIVIISSIIGVSQTEGAMPRILRRFKTDLDRTFPGMNVALPNDCLDSSHTRVFHGGLYSWQPAKRPLHNGNKKGKFMNRVKITIQSGFLPSALIVAGSLTAIIVSYLVPPDGWDCRNIGEVVITLAWVISAQLDTLFGYLVPYTRKRRTLVFWVTGVKDLIVTLSTMLGIVATQIGVFNRCACYTRWGRTGVALPEMPDVKKILIHRMQTVYPAVIFTCIGVQLIIVPSYICIRYRHAVRVFLQRDDGRSNAKWLWKVYERTQLSKSRLQNYFQNLLQFRRSGDRGRTITTKEGYSVNLQRRQYAYGHIDLVEEPENISVKHREKIVSRDPGLRTVPIDFTGASAHGNTTHPSSVLVNFNISSYSVLNLDPRRHLADQ